MTDPRIDCASDSSPERTIRDELVDLLSRFDLAPWTFTHRVVVEEVYHEGRGLIRGDGEREHEGSDA